jgi:hypothetical protein
VSEPLFGPRNFRRIGLRVALPAILLALLKPAAALAALALVPASLLELWALPRVRSERWWFPHAISLAAAIVAFVSSAAAVSQVIYADATWMGGSPAAGLEELASVWRQLLLGQLGKNGSIWLFLAYSFSSSVGIVTCLRLTNPRPVRRLFLDVALVSGVMGAIPMFLLLAEALSWKRTLGDNLLGALLVGIACVLASYPGFCVAMPAYEAIDWLEARIFRSRE